MSKLVMCHLTGGLFRFATILSLGLIPSAFAQRPADVKSEEHELRKGAEESKRDVQNRGRLSYESAKTSRTPFYTPPVFHSANDVLDHELVVKYRDVVFNGTTVHLRSYTDALHGPTLQVRPGDVLRVRVRNELPSTDISDASGHLNTTNLHTHGLQVSPEDNSDNVFLAVRPSGVFDFEYKIPSWHAPGTHWYHAHSHGSTAVQVSSGMAGALIIQGGLDDIPEIRQAKDMLFLFQQIPYDSNGAIESIEQVQAWSSLGRETTINGQLQPVITMAPGEVQRWRLIHGGVAEKLELIVREEATGSLQPLVEVATDGIPFVKKRETKQLDLGPGYRSDVLFKAPTIAGDYYLVDKQSPAGNTFRKNRDKADNYLLKINVSGAPVSMDLPSDASLMNLPRPESIDGQVPTRVQEIVFAGGDEPGSAKINGVAFSPQHTDVISDVGTVEEWRLSTNLNPPVNAPHPFHIHVNPFFVELTDPASGVRYSTWKDTLLIGTGSPTSIKIRFHEDFPGKTVFHCHRLDHEDQGMMGVIRINAKRTSTLTGGGAQTGLSFLGKAPRWELTDLRGRPHKSPDFEGRPLLLVLFRGLGCLHCVQQLELLRENQASLNQFGFRVVLISSDKSEDLQRAVQAYRQPLPFPILPDPNLRIFEAYECADSQRKEPLHGVFVIDKDANVRWRHRSPDALLDIDPILAACAVIASERSQLSNDVRSAIR